MTRPYVQLGADLRVVAEHADGVELEGAVRLAPGRPVDIVVDGPTSQVRPAVVWSCQLIRMERDAPVYRGYCRWA